MITVKAPEYNKRLEICKACPHFVKSTGTCGTALKGDLVPVKGKKRKVRTCGCIMRIKAKLTWAECPVGNWGGYVTKKNIKDVESLLKEIDKKNILKGKMIPEFFKVYNNAFNTRKNATQCKGCILIMIKEMRDALKRYKQAEES